MGTEESQARTILSAMVLAFGPPQDGRSSPEVARLAEVLWQSVPARAQRQLRELCDDTAELDYNRVLASSRRVLRRAALFVSGDFGLSLRQLVSEEKLGAVPSKLEDLAVLCREHPSAADLVRLATSPEYAEVRWQVPNQRSAPPHHSENP
jgi:hypothetical protein